MSEIGGYGPHTSRVSILSGEPPSISDFREHQVFTGWAREFLKTSLLQAGLHPSEIRFDQCKGTREETLAYLNSMPELELIIPMGSKALEWVTGKVSIDKWHLSPLDTVDELRAPKAVPTFPPKRVMSEFRLQLYVIKAMQRAKVGLDYPGPWKRKTLNFHSNPKFDETIDILKSLQSEPILANDVETGNGVINTVGFAWSTTDAIAINTLPERLSDEKYHVLWDHIRILLESDQKKIYQNLIYENLYYSKYGIRCSNNYWDTMWAMRVLWPEFEIGLDNVGRFYTNEQYWKDVGKDHKGEGKKKDWGNIKDWTAHYHYNMLDCAGTMEAYENQLIDFKSRGIQQLELFTKYVMPLSAPIVEMCSRGLPVNEVNRLAMEVEVGDKIKELMTTLPEGFNPKSPKQKKEFLKAKGYTIPKARVAGKMQESTNELAVKKLRLKHPEDKDLSTLLKLAKHNKALGSYIKFGYDDDGYARYMMNGVGTETLRFSSSKDPWGNGFNAQTLPKDYKKLFDAPEGQTWFQIDLAQAESRFVAYDCCDETLIRMLEDPKEDIHGYVAAGIFECSEEQVQRERRAGDISKRQLGKKSGHGANYAMAANTFMESCLKEMDLVLSRKESQKVLDTYHSLFPGIRRWHASIRKTLYDTRKLSNPFGYTRYFYGRMDDNTFREAYAFKPQSTIPMITNRLMLHLLGLRTEGKLDFSLHNQVHDSVLILAKDDPDHYLPIRDVAQNLDLWHPEIILPAGQLKIPTDCEVGTNLGRLKDL